MTLVHLLPRPTSFPPLLKTISTARPRCRFGLTVGWPPPRSPHCRTFVLFLGDYSDRSPEPNIVHHTVLVRGFGWDVTAEALLAAFQTYGYIKDCNVLAGSEDVRNVFGVSATEGKDTTVEIPRDPYLLPAGDTRLLSQSHVIPIYCQLEIPTVEPIPAVVVNKFRLL